MRVLPECIMFTMYVQGPTEARRTHWNWVVVFHYIEYWELNLGPL